MIDLATLASCTHLTTEHAKQAASSLAQLRALLRRVSEIARPGEGCPKVLMAMAHLVGQDWIEGDLRVELTGDETSTTLAVMCEYGVGIRERVVPATRLDVPLDEFERALELSPRLVLPLKITDEGGRLVLTPLARGNARAVSAPPPPIELEQESLGEEERTTAPPPTDQLLVVDEAVPEDVETLEALDALEASDELVPVGEPEPLIPDAAPTKPMRFDSGEIRSMSNADSAPEMEQGKPRDSRGGERASTVHTRPTVRRMVAIDAAAIAAARRRDPRREDD